MLEKMCRKGLGCHPANTLKEVKLRGESEESIVCKQLALKLETRDRCHQLFKTEWLCINDFISQKIKIKRASNILKEFCKIVGESHFEENWLISLYLYLYH